MVSTKGAALRRVEVITGVERRRRWSAEEKARVLEETTLPGAVISEVARHNGLTPQQLFTWRRQARRTATKLRVVDAAAFVPAIVEESIAPLPAPNTEMVVKPPPVLELEIDGSSVWVWGDAEIELVTAVVRALKGGR
jgi:transposase